MIIFPNCKINLGLHILEKRSDGYHNLETVFYPVPLKDILEIIQADKKKEAGTEIQISLSGLPLEENPDNNLCIKAYQILKNDFPELPPVLIHLHKAIPIGAGLGGGSADGSFTLMLINKKFNLGLTTEKLTEYSLQLGSDCPFFITNHPCLASGRGEIVRKIELDLSEYKFVIVAPGIHINTAWAFSQLKQQDFFSTGKKISDIIKQPVTSWKSELLNDFEKIVFTNYPEIREIKEKLYETGAVYSSLSGSGSAVFGIFRKEDIIDLNFPAQYFVRKLNSKLH